VLHIALLTAALISTEIPVEAPIVPGSVPLEDPGRYRSGRPYDETVLFYERIFRRVAGERWHNIVNLPGIKAKNVESRRTSTNWEYINIYETRGQVRIYVIPRERPPEPPPTEKKKKNKR
jgi:hypothetical protein